MLVDLENGSYSIHSSEASRFWQRIHSGPGDFAPNLGVHYYIISFISAEMHPPYQHACLWWVMGELSDRREEHLSH